MTTAAPSSKRACSGSNCPQTSGGAASWPRWCDYFAALHWFWCVFVAVVADTSPFEAAFMKVLGKTAPIEEMDMEKAMSAAGLVDHFDVEARGPLFALRLLCAVVFCALFAGLASGQRLQRAPNAHQEGSEAFWWESGLCPFHLCGPALVSCADCVCSTVMHLRFVCDQVCACVLLAARASLP